ncbi:MAG: type II secretion system ATPase GspE [Candidatus Tectomicrobia bacterium]|uniref:protein-secreting ATPase n=1 Tax=Tectimicrobiota bacterium TaxID=2528274 RepID=A0A932CLP9_UNCTE|nr:type II secretion system ATPase GspE [Candidatus Tectomicrobia bacterium]
MVNHFATNHNHKRKGLLNLVSSLRERIAPKSGATLFPPGPSPAEGPTLVKGNNSHRAESSLLKPARREEEWLQELSEELEIPYISLGQLPEAPYIIGTLPLKFMREHKVFPFRLKDNILSLVVQDPLDIYTLDAIRLATGFQLDLHLGRERDILEAIEQYYGSGATTMEKIIEDMQGEEVPLSYESEEDVERLKDIASEAPVIRLVNLLITKAVERGASDIHIEPYEDALYVRYRIDGILQDTDSPPKRLQAAIISRVKIMAKLNIAERRLPQDGRIRLRVLGKEIDLRVSAMPTVYGESVVMRILDRSSIVFSLERLGFGKDTLQGFHELIVKPYGIILVTGPTGSGKTTTLYAALEKINSKEKKIITVEDPVEYQLTGVNQIQVKPQIGLTFGHCLRAIVRQEPDSLMSGEIRDLETAEIAIQSALTGHLVFSTLHTNDAAGAITRLVDMGIEHFLVASSLEGILAQRLVRVLCDKCKEPYLLAQEVQKDLGIEEVEGDVVIFRPTGCAECSHTGYRGRTGIFELLMVGEEIRDLVMRKTSSNVIRNRAVELGMRLLRQDGWRKVLKGITSIEEVLRVTQE